MRTRTSLPTRSTTRIAVATAAAALIAAACAPQEDPDVEEVVTEPVEEPTEPPEEPAEPTEPVEAPEEPTEEAPADDEEVAGDAAMLEGDASADPATAEGEIGVLAVTDVRVATHEGFDRVVFQLEGDGLVGWDVRYVDEATSQGSGEPIEVEGDAVLAVSLSNITLPPDLPDDIERWDEDRVDGTGDVIAAVVEDTIFEGIQTFFAGLDEERPFLIERFEDPQRVVIDIPHG